MISSFIILTLLGTKTPYMVRPHAISALTVQKQNCALTLWGNENEIIVNEPCSRVADQIADFEAESTEITFMRGKKL